MDSEDVKPHIIFLPYMAPGHMMPLVDMARLLAAHDVKVTIITTTANANSFKDSIDRDIKSGRQIQLETLQFPSVEAGLPQGCENLISTPTPEMTIKLFRAIQLLRPKMEQLICDQRPHCIASDVLFPWTANVANELGIPRLAFSGSGFFNLCVSYCIEKYEPHKDITSETETFVLPTLPDQIKLTRSQLPDIVKTRTNVEFSKLFDELKEAEKKSFGVLVNSFYELEPAYADYYKKEIGIKAWHLGPVSLFNKDAEDKIDRGGKASVSKQYLSWLDSKKPNSVIYVCLGSLTRFNRAQLSELACALEESNHFFIWVVSKVLKQPTNNEENEEWWLPEGFNDRVNQSGKGLVITGWAPQVLILEHPSIGGFLTHCGWNSILESVSAGVPMVTWPIFAEQFYNEKLATQVLNIGVPVGNEVWKVWATDETELMTRDKIKKAVCTLMNEGDDATEMRRRARQISESAKKVVEQGGSSYNDMKAIIEEIKLYRKN